VVRVSLRHRVELTVIRLCTETPRAGGRVFETGDEKLLQLAYRTQSAFLATSSCASENDGAISTKSAPVVVAFTKYDLLVKSKRVRLQWDNKGLDSEVLDKQSEDEARKVLDICVQSLEEAMSRLKTQMPRYVNISSIISPCIFFSRR
jgi:hypothetical protein